MAHKQNHTEENSTDREHRDEAAADTGRGTDTHDEGRLHGSSQRAEAHDEQRAGGILRGSLDAEELGPQIGAAAIAAVGMALLDVELLPAVLIGAGATLAPKLFPGAGNLLRPLVKGAVRFGYGAVNKAQHVAAEATEQVRDMVAEVKAEEETARRAARIVTPAEGK